MMEDQLREYEEYLLENGYEAKIKDGGIQISVNVEKIDIVLYCVLGKFFPYEIPRVFLLKLPTPKGVLNLENSIL